MTPSLTTHLQNAQIEPMGRKNTPQRSRPPGEAAVAESAVAVLSTVFLGGASTSTGRRGAAACARCFTTAARINSDGLCAPCAVLGAFFCSLFGVCAAP